MANLGRSGIVVWWFYQLFSKMIPNEFWGIEFWRLGKEHIPEERIGQGAAWALKFSSKHLKIPWPVWIQGPRNAWWNGVILLLILLFIASCTDRRLSLWVCESEFFFLTTSKRIQQNGVTNSFALRVSQGLATKWMCFPKFHKCSSTKHRLVFQSWDPSVEFHHFMFYFKKHPSVWVLISLLFERHICSRSQFDNVCRHATHYIHQIKAGVWLGPFL